MLPSTEAYIQYGSVPTVRWVVQPFIMVSALLYLADIAAVWYKLMPKDQKHLKNKVGKQETYNTVDCFTFNSDWRIRQVSTSAI